MKLPLEILHFLLKCLRVIAPLRTLKVDQSDTIAVDKKVVLVRVPVLDAQMMQSGKDLPTKLQVGWTRVSSADDFLDQESDYPTMLVQVTEESGADALAPDPLISRRLRLELILLPREPGKLGDRRPA